jgi:putative DNA primase/helicase
MAVGRAWIIEWAELESVRRSAVGSVKAFLTRRVDRFRPPYGRELIDVPRSSVIVGTTNEEQFLQDGTGNRRYMVIPVGMIDIDAVREIRDQLWAEAYVRHGYGEPWHLTAEEEALQRNDNAELVSEDPWKATIERWLSRNGTLNMDGTHRTTLQEVLRGCLEIPTERQGRQQQMRVAQVLSDLGWRRAQIMLDAKKTWVYRSPPGFSAAERFTDAF